MQDGYEVRGEWLNRAVRRISVWCLTAAMFCAGRALADTYTWSAATEGAAQDGAGTWNTSAANWVGAGGAHAAWNNANGDTAAFGAGGTAGEVAVDAGGITIGGLLFNAVASGAYTLSGGALTLTGAPVFAANADAALRGPLAGSAGFTKTGSGTLTFGGSESTFTGDVNIDAGTVVCDGMNQGGTNSVLGRANIPRTIAVGSGATLQFNAHDTFGNDGKYPAVTVAVNGGTIRNNSSFTTFGLLNLLDASLVSSGGANPGFQAYQLKGTVTSGGNSTIGTTGGTYNGVHVCDNTFAVTNGTLTVSAPLIARPGFGNTAGGFTKTGAGSMILAADNSFGGNVVVSNGLLQVGVGGAAGTLGTGAGAVSLVNSDASLVLNRTGNLTISGAVSGSGSVSQLGAGLVMLAGGNSYTGNTAVSNGILAVEGLLSGYDASGKITVGPGAGLSVDAGLWSAAQVNSLLVNASFGANAFLGFGTVAGNATVSDSYTLGNGMGLIKTGPNVLTLSGNNSYPGGTVVYGGVLRADFGAGISGSTNVTLNGGTYAPTASSLTASLGAGAGQINIAAGSASGFSAFGAPLDVNLGGAAASLSWGGALFNPGTFVLNEAGANAALTLENGIDLNGATRTIAVNASEAAIAGTLANGGLVKNGAGKLTLTAANTYAGGTTVNAGTLALSGGNDRLNTGGGIAVNAGTLDLGGGSQTLTAGGFSMANGTTLQNGTLNYYTSWSPNWGASVIFQNGGAFVTDNRLLLLGGQSLTLASNAGNSLFGGDGSGSGNFVGVDNGNTNTVVVNGGSLNFTNMAAGAGYLRIGANGNAGSKPVGRLTVNGGAVNVGHSMNLGGRYDNGRSSAYGDATLALNGGEVNVGTGSGTSAANGNRGWLYMGNGDASTVSRSEIDLNGGTLSLVQLEAGAYGTNTLNLNGGTLKARANAQTFIDGANLTCGLGTKGATVDTAGYNVGVAATLTGPGGLIKQGAGTLALSSGNTYSGRTQVEGGTLSLSPVPPLAGLRLHLDASDSSTLFENADRSGAVVASGQNVGYWGDLSDSGAPATQSIGERRPVYLTNVAAFNGRSVLQFDGADDDITSALDFNAANLPNVTLMIVYKQVAKTANGGLWGHDDGGWDRLQLLNFSNGGVYDGYGISTGSGWSSVQGMNTNGVVFYTAVLRNGVSNGSYVYINGLSDGAHGLPAFTSVQGSGLASLTLANISPGNGYRGNIQIGEVLVFDHALSDATRANLEAHLKNKWLGASPAVAPVLQSGSIASLTNSVLGNLKLHLDASDASSLKQNPDGSSAVTASGQTVGCWTDLSGNGKAATQDSAERRPTYVASSPEFDGRSVLQFDGVNDDITSSLDINRVSIPNMTLVLIYRQVSKTANSGLWGHDDGGWDRLQLMNFSMGGAPDGYGISTGTGATGVNGLNTNGVVIYTAALNNGVAGGSYVYVNGLSDATHGLPAFTSSEDVGNASLTLANISPGNAFPCNLQIGEVLVFDRALSDAERGNVEAYLRDKWLGVVPGRVELASGTTLDLAGASQTLTSVSGSGTIANGALAVTTGFSPAGDGVVGSLGVANASLNGTLLLDVSSDGAACDQLAAVGDLSVTGLTLTVTDLSRLSRKTVYTPVTCTGQLTGPFAATNLPKNWYIRYSAAAKAVTFYYAAPGTLITVR